MMNPESLLQLAKKYNKFFELEVKFIVEALKHLNNRNINGKKVFFNISPKNLEQLNINNIFTEENLKKY